MEPGDEPNTLARRTLPTTRPTVEPKQERAAALDADRDTSIAACVGLGESAARCCRRTRTDRTDTIAFAGAAPALMTLGRFGSEAS
jgi:hypothetical protein